MDIDVTALFQIGFFLFLLISLNGLIIKPLMNVIQQREQQTTGTQEEVVRLQKQGDSDMEAYQARMREARKEAHKAREALKEEGRSHERDLLAKARAEVAQAMAKARAEVEDAEKKAQDTLFADTDAVAKQVVGKVLNREVSA